MYSVVLATQRFGFYQTLSRGYFDPAAAYSNSSDTRHGTVQEVQNNGHKQAVVQGKYLKYKIIIINAAVIYVCS